MAAVSALGGLLFGYHTGIISGALLYLREDLHLSSRGQEVVVSAILVGAMIGPVASGRLSGRPGRRRLVLRVGHRNRDRNDARFGRTRWRRGLSMEVSEPGSGGGRGHPRIAAPGLGGPGRFTGSGSGLTALFW
ncbi:MFS transporter [Streptomyces sp. NPDC006289]|uniref:MFS transporter n=1 Tax=Streptomyces sp. NPDC006289 TaxID=3156744 RepID=UPI0033B4844A